MSVVRATVLLIVAIVALVCSVPGRTIAQTAPEVPLPPGDAIRGKALFENSRNNCLGCHRVGAVGSLFGPDLSAIGAPPRGAAGGAGRGGPAAAPAAARGAAPAVAPPIQAQQLAQSILDPNAVISVQNRYVLIKLKDGKTISGKLLNIDTFGIQIFDATEKLINVPRSDMRDMTMTSPMPSYRDKLTNQELADVVAYLISLKGQ